MKKVLLPKTTRLSVRFCDLCGTRLVKANTNRRCRTRCITCSTPRGRREAVVSLRRQTQVIAGFKPSSFWKDPKH